MAFFFPLAFVISGIRKWWKIRQCCKRCIGLPAICFHPENRRLPDKRHEPTARKYGQETHRGRCREILICVIRHSRLTPSYQLENPAIFGPLMSRKPGDKAQMEPGKFILLYRKLISMEQKAEINYNDSTVFLNG